MKKIITSASLMAIGALSVQAAYAPGLSATERTKPWSVSATLRGFYDDNYATRPSGPLKRDSFGVEISPSVSLNFPLERTLISAGYTYGARWYEDREDDQWDQSHLANFKLNHAFTEDYKLDIFETFVVAQEPELVDPNNNDLMRSEGNNIRNTAGINFDARLSRLFSVLVGYSNNIFDYEEDGDGSYSAYLDRMEHMITANLRWHVKPETIAILGYQYGIVDQTSNDRVVVNGVLYDATVRDNNSHYVYIGVDQTFTPQLNAAVRLGVQYTTYPDAPASVDDESLTPYADASLTYTYTKNSYVQVGIKNSRSANDIASLDSEILTMYASVTHQFTAKLKGSLIGQYQLSSFNQGPYDGENDNYYGVGANLGYQFNQYFGADLGYNYDQIDSDVDGRGYSRNRVYLGVRASY